MREARTVRAKDLDLHIERTVAPRQGPTYVTRTDGPRDQVGCHHPGATFSPRLAAVQTCIGAGRGANWAAVGRPVRTPGGACISGSDNANERGNGNGKDRDERSAERLARWSGPGPGRCGGLQARRLVQPVWRQGSRRVGQGRARRGAGRRDPDWNNSRVLKGDAVTEVSKLKRELDGEIVVPASYQLGRTLIEHGLVDELRLVVFPVVLGAGERFLGETSGKKPMRLVDTKTIGDGLVFLTYELVRGT